MCETLLNIALNTFNIAFKEFNTFNMLNAQYPHWMFYQVIIHANSRDINCCGVTQQEHENNCQALSKHQTFYGLQC